MARNINRHKNHEINPDEIFLDSSNLPEFNNDQFEGRMEKPIPRRNILVIGGVFALIGLIFLGKLWSVQIAHGQSFKDISEKNRLHNALVFAERGVIYDRMGTPLAWNEVNATSSDFSLRNYIDLSGFSGLLGYVNYPAKDSSGFYYDDTLTGSDGLEKFYNTSLAGENGLKITETDATGNALSESTIRPPKKGDNLTLSIDARVQHEMYDAIANTAQTSGFDGGAGVLMNIHTGEVLAMVSYPEYNSNVMTEKSDQAKIKAYLNDKNNPFLDRVTTGLYTPGSIIKPIFAIGALNEGVIDAQTKILSTGSISIPNPYQPGTETVFKDWRVNGWTNLMEALSVSSDVYFYEIGGGYQNQKGLNISNLEKYASLFGFGTSLDGTFFSGKKGTIPSPEWKAANFNGEPWRLGDTYHTAIGQYGFQVTPIQAVRAVAAIANSGHLITPSILKSDPANSPSVASSTILASINPAYYQDVRDGMRLGVTAGTVQGLSMPQVAIAAKTGTAELGTQKQYVNSWVTGFYPYQSPDYAFVLLLEHGPAHYASGAPATMRTVMEWMSVNTPEYLK